MRLGALAWLWISVLAATGAAGAERDVESLRGVAAFDLVLEYQPRPGTASYLELTQQEQLQAAVETRLRGEGLPVREIESPRLRVLIESGGDDHGTIMYGVRLDFMRRRPDSGDATLLKTWHLDSWGLVDNRQMQSIVERELEAGLDELVHDWFSVNPRASRHQSER